VSLRGQRTDKQDNNDRHIAGREQAEAEENNHEPGHQYHQNVIGYELCPYFVKSSQRVSSMSLLSCKARDEASAGRRSVETVAGV